MREVKRALGYLLFPCDTKEKGNCALGTVTLSPPVPSWEWDRKGGMEAPRISIRHAPPGSPSERVGDISVLNGEPNFRISLQTPLNQILPFLYYFFIEILEWLQFQTPSLTPALLLIPHYRRGFLL